MYDADKNHNRKAAPLPAPAHEHPAERTDAAAPEPPAGTSRVAAGDRATARSAPQPWNPARLERTDIPRRRRGRAAAPQAAGVIHTDFERGFIRAQTIAFEDFITYGGEQGAKEAGKMRAEGKEYVVKDGDVLNFLFNV